MPEMDGYEVASRLKADPVTSNIPIIMVTALIDRSARLIALDSGVEGFMTKPIDRGELWLKVRNMLRLKMVADLRAFAHEEILFINARLEERVREHTAQLHAAQEELEAFSYSVSHDLRAPLQCIDGFSRMLGDEMGSGAASERSIHCITRIRAGVRQMADLIEGQLSLAGASHAALRSKRIDLSAMAQAVVAECCERDPGREVVFDISPGMEVQGDERLLRQVLANLLGNAWKFSSGQSDARITFEGEVAPDGSTVYAVRDNGVGFDMACSGGLFRPFHRLHTTVEFPGTGIGLAIVRRIITRHGGKIWAESKPGQGAAFYFTLGRPTA